MDNRTCTRVDLLHSILKNSRFALACVMLLFVRVSTGNIEKRSEPLNYDRNNTRMMVSNGSVSDSSTIEADYWEMKNQRGVSRNQILRFRKIGNRGETFRISVLLLSYNIEEDFADGPNSFLLETYSRLCHLIDYVTCYELTCTGNGCMKGAADIQKFCYPSIVVTGPRILFLA